MGKHTGKISNAATKMRMSATEAVSHLYSQDAIIRNAANKTHDGDSMSQVFEKIHTATNLTTEEQGSKMIYKMADEKTGSLKQVGWSDVSRGIGWFDDKAYKKLEFPEVSDRELPDNIECDFDIDDDNFAF